MFDLSNSMNLPVNKKQNLELVLFHQTDEYRQLIEEVFRFEGISEPLVLDNTEEVVAQHARKYPNHIIMIELNTSHNVVSDIERISHLLPNNAPVIVLGKENSISVIRALKDMGYYYLFCPATKTELFDFVSEINEKNMKKELGSTTRKAKKIAVLGAKGGVGTSFIAAELSKELSGSRNSSCVVVDHNIRGGNLDIMLGMKHFKRRKLTQGMLLSNLDVDYATNMVTKLNDMLSLLSIESDNFSIEEMKEYISVLTSQLALQANFIIEDLSGSASEKLSYLIKSADVDAVVLVADQTVSSLREAALVVNTIKEKNLPIRVIVVVNHTKPEKYSTIESQEVEKYINKNIDVICPFEPKLGTYLLHRDSIYTKDIEIAQSLNRITALLLGEEEIKKSSLLKRLIKRL
ncbi:AAA family ATPase [Aliivibrio fischeri]|uniref:AAA family ATPase n=1 Tax=Aliivibrio fischeri TaxID=668 RepID=UPI0012D94A48|nr:P-loop NTPase [Aliivibrio fischeri]MUI55815.1 P-loop NTPase [Aliivibrio fischeri]